MESMQMNKQLQDTILSFTQSTPRTIAEVADHIYITLKKHPDRETVAKDMRDLARSGLVKKVANRRMKYATNLSQYLATTMDERIALEDSKQKVTTPSVTFLNDPIMAVLYRRQNI